MSKPVDLLRSFVRNAADLATSSVNGPTAVRRSARRCATPPNASPRSAANVRMYVPDEHST